MFLRSVANPARIQILGAGMREEASLAELMVATGLSKTALLNHLSQLIGVGLLQRVDRGTYRTTVDGRGLLSAASGAYRGSVRRTIEQKDMLRRTYASSLGGAAELDEHELKKVEYPPCWLSYLGAMAGCLRYLGVKCGTVEVGGTSGYSFLINVSEGETCPSGPTALHMSTFRKMVRGTEDLGWKLDVYTYPHTYPAKEGRPNAREIELARAIFERVKKEIDDRQRPAVLWGLGAPEYGIVSGYQGDSYIVRTFMGSVTPGKQEDLIRYHDLKAVGCIDAFFFSRKLRVSPKKVREAALARALAFAEGDVQVQSHYVAGPPALDEWADVLQSVDDAGQNYMGNSYVGACVREGREISSQFLKRVAKKLPSQQARHLLLASESYRRGSRLMLSFTKTFPFRSKGGMPFLKRKKGAQLLRKTRVEEESAIKHMKRVC